MGRLRAAGRHVGAALGLAALVVVTYGGALGHEFVFDDWQLVVGNDFVTWPPSRAFDLFEQPPGGVSYRPVRMISYVFDHWIGGGLEPRVFHASNLAYHAATVLLLYVLAQQTIGSWAGGLIAAAIFAVHPLGSEAVAYVSGRRDLLSGAFVLLGLVAWWDFLGAAAGRGGRVAARAATSLVVVLVAWAGALGAKENAITFPALALLLAVVRARRGATARGGAAWLVASAVMAVVVSWVVFDRLYLDRVWDAWTRLQGEPLAAQPALTIGVLDRYAGLALWPAELLADYRSPVWPLPTAPFDAHTVSSLALWAGLVVTAGWLVWRGHVAGAGLLWFPIGLAPVAQIVPYREVIAEHNAYIPLAGLALAAGEGAALLVRRRPVAGWIAAGLVVAALSVRAHARTEDWRDDETLWTATLEAVPESVRARHNLAVAWARAGRLGQAHALLEETLEDAPSNLEVVMTLATLEGRMGNDRAARSLARKATRLDPSGESFAFLGWAELSAGAESAARRAFREALRRSPRLGEARRGLAELREREAQRRYLREGKRR